VRGRRRKKVLEFTVRFPKDLLFHGRRDFLAHSARLRAIDACW